MEEKVMLPWKSTLGQVLGFARCPLIQQQKTDNSYPSGDYINF